MTVLVSLKLNLKSFWDIISYILIDFQGHKSYVPDKIRVADVAVLVGYCCINILVILQ